MLILGGTFLDLGNSMCDFALYFTDSFNQWAVCALPSLVHNVGWITECPV